MNMIESKEDERITDELLRATREFVLNEFIKEAETGKVAAQYRLSRLYGEIGDKTKELFWLEKAAHSMKSVRVRLANLYFDGIGCEVSEENDRKAFYWLWSLIQSDNYAAINNIAWAYKNGRGCLQDHIQARKFFEQARDNSSKTDYCHLERIY